jgi:hypothetical protein
VAATLSEKMRAAPRPEKNVVKCIIVQEAKKIKRPNVKNRKKECRACADKLQKNNKRRIRSMRLRLNVQTKGNETLS